MLRLARFITFVLHPLVLICPAVYLIILLNNHTHQEAFIWTVASLLFTLIVVGYILYGMRRGFFSNFDISKRKQRIYLFPFVIGIGLLFLGILITFNGPSALYFTMIYFILAVSILALVNMRIKASIHVGSLTAILVSGVYFFGTTFLPFLLLIPIMAWARVVEKKHTVKETVVGAIMGILLAFLGIFIVYYFLGL